MSTRPRELEEAPGIGDPETSGRPIRVSFCANSFVMGGMENHVIQLATSVRNLGCEVSAVLADVPAIAPFAEALQQQGVPVDRVTLQGKQSMARYGTEAARLRQILKQRRIDVFHQHRTGPYHGKWACLAARSAGVGAIIATEHLPPFPLRGVVRTINSAADRVVDRIVTVCELDRQRQLRDTWRSASKVLTIHNGIDLSRFALDTGPNHSAGTRRELGLEGRSPVLGVVARLSVEKGHIHLLNALAVLVQQWPDLTVLIVGDGPERASLEAASAQLHLTKNVRFLGQRSDVKSILLAIDILVLPSLKESFPIALLEAMAMRLPVVATDVGGVSEAVIDGETGFVVPPARPDCLASAISKCVNEGAQAAMGAAGRARVERFYTSDVMARKAVALYREVVTGKRP